MSLRGTEVALFDYAFFNEKLLGNRSIVVYDGSNKDNHPLVIEKFKNAGLDLRSVSHFDLVDDIIESEKCDCLYTIKGSGKSDGRLSKKCKNLVHMTGAVKLKESYGDVFAYVSSTLNIALNGPIESQNAHVVPHMINLPDIKEDFRKEWNIPKDAFVIGRTGGLDTWNIPFVNQCLKFALDNRPDLYFCAQNTNIPFKNHPKIIQVPAIADLVQKTKFINTCDAMLHARDHGETFGIAIGEFSSKGKQIIVGEIPYPGKVCHHLTVLQDKALIYRNPNDLLKILLTIQKPDNQQSIDDLNCYKEYNPESVMATFSNVFFSSLTK